MTNPAFEKILSRKNPRVQEIANDLRTLLTELKPELTEVVWEKQKIASYGVGPKKVSEHYCYIAPQKDHVNLGFYYGSELKDSAELLEGTGKFLRHVKIRSRDEVHKPSLMRLLRRAQAHLPRLQR